MADEGDMSVKHEEEALKVALANHQNQPKVRPLPYIGLCHYCQEAVPKPERFCDEDCKDDYQYERERREALRA